MMEIPSAQASAQKPAFLKWSGWYLTALKLAVGLLLVLLITLLWLSRQNAEEQQRSTLIADVLWLEQNVNFRLEGIGEQFRQLSHDLSMESDKQSLFKLRGRHLLRNSPELQQLVWLNASGREIDAMPAPTPARPTPDEAAKAARSRALELASKLGKAVYTDSFSIDGVQQFDFIVPIFENRHYLGSLVGTFSLNTLLKEQVPWWFAEKYLVRILDGSGNVLASKSKFSDAVTILHYTVPFDPPGFGMALQVSAYSNPKNTAQSLIIALIVSLFAAVLWSLWVMRGHIRRRLDAEQALRSEHAFRKAMEDSLTVGMRARDLDGRVTYANPAFCQMVGFTADELMAAQPPMPYWAPEELERTQSIHTAVMEGKSPLEGFELRFMRKDGTRFDALIYEAPLIDADGRHTGWMASIVDVTARKQIEELTRKQQEKLQLTSRLVTMGEMASTLAHELNQPLAAITSYNTGCLNKLESGNFSTDELKVALEKLAVQAQRAGRIIRRVHDFVRKSEPKLALCDLAEVIDDSIGFVEATAKSLNVRIVREIQGMRPELMADQGMLEQVLLNLMRNGIEAMKNSPREERLLTIKLGQSGDQMQIQVIDRGSGISPEAGDKLFTPFFSTKEEGMGMGLNICRSIIEFHHGRLWFENNPDGGTIFFITLPIPSP